MASWRERWRPEERAFFEYHCTQAHDSAHAELWYRSHQPVTVISEPLGEDHSDTAAERAEEGNPYVYRVRFQDGYEEEAFEDELLTRESAYDPRWGPGRRR